MKIVFGGKLKIQNFSNLFADPLKTEDLEIGRFIESKFGNSLLMDKAGYIYRANRKRNSKIYWMCRENKIRGLKCPAKAVTQGVYIIGLSEQHIHQPTEPQKQNYDRKYGVTKL